MTVEPQLATRIVPASGKIYDITHADTTEHSVALPAGYPANTRLLQVRAERIAGAGNFLTRSTSGDAHTEGTIVNYSVGLWFRALDGLFYYLLSTANDDWDIYITGYITGAP